MKNVQLVYTVRAYLLTSSTSNEEFKALVDVRTEESWMKNIPAVAFITHLIVYLLTIELITK